MIYSKWVATNLGVGGIDLVWMMDIIMFMFLTVLQQCLLRGFFVGENGEEVRLRD
jgi:hypothetical protein